MRQERKVARSTEMDSRTAPFPDDVTRMTVSPVQLNVFRVLWELYDPGKQVRPKALPPKKQRDKIDREKILNAFSTGT